MFPQPKYITTPDGYLKLPAYRPPTDSDYAFGDDYEHLIAHCMYDPNETMFGFEIGEQEGESELLGQILKLAACRHAGWPGANGDQKIVELVQAGVRQLRLDASPAPQIRKGVGTKPAPAGRQVAGRAQRDQANRDQGERAMSYWHCPKCGSHSTVTTGAPEWAGRVVFIALTCTSTNPSHRLKPRLLAAPTRAASLSRRPPSLTSSALS